MLQLPPLPHPQPPTLRSPRRERSNPVTGTEGCYEHPPEPFEPPTSTAKIKMSVSTTSSTLKPAPCNVRRRCRDHWKRQAELKNRARTSLIADPTILERRPLC